MTWRDLDMVYWGIYLGDERSDASKIDIWQTRRQAFELVRRFGDGLSARLNDTNRAVILEIKAACWRHPQYRRGSGVLGGPRKTKGIPEPPA